MRSPHYLKLPIATLLCALGSVIAQGQETNPAAPPATFPVHITVDAGRDAGELHSIWRFFGADEANYGYMKYGQKLLGELGQLGGGQVYFRCHHLLTSGDGSYALKWGSTSAYKEDAQGNPIYDWTINDRIFDSYLARAVRATGFHARGAEHAPGKLSAQSAGDFEGAGGRGAVVSAEGLRQVGRTGVSMGQTLRGEVWESGSGAVVLGSLE